VRAHSGSQPRSRFSATRIAATFPSTSRTHRAAAWRESVELPAATRLAYANLFFDCVKCADAFQGLGCCGRYMQHMDFAGNRSSFSGCSERRKPGYIFPQALRDPYSLQWNVSLERAAGEHESVVVSYVGASGLDLLLPQRRQIASPATPLQEVITFPSGFSSRFDSLQLAYRGQYRSRLAWMTSYVWGHAMDFGSPILGQRQREAMLIPMFATTCRRLSRGLFRK